MITYIMHDNLHMHDTTYFIPGIGGSLNYYMSATIFLNGNLGSFGRENGSEQFYGSDLFHSFFTKAPQLIDVFNQMVLSYLPLSI